MKEPPVQLLDATASREEWLAERAKTVAITATDITSICGLNPYHSAWEVYQEKVGAGIDEEPAEAATLGLALEPLLSELAEKHPELAGNWLWQPGFLQHHELEWVRATPDRFAIDEEATKDSDVGMTDLPILWPHTTGVVELKSALGYAAQDYDDDVVPDRHIFQVQWQLATTGLDNAWIVALTGPRLRVYVIERDDDLIGNLLTIGDAFLRDHVHKFVEPDPDSTDRLAKSLAKRWRPDPDKVAELDAGLYWSLRWEIEDAARIAKDATARETAAKNKLRTIIADAEALKVDGEIVATWKQGTRAGYTVQPTTTRTLRFTKKGRSA